MNKRTGTLCVFLAALLYSIGGLCIKVIPWNGLSINSGRTLIALVVIGGYLAIIRHKPGSTAGSFWVRCAPSAPTPSTRWPTS